jgi:uncharacterized repeat protein (TIGR01451 family)
MRRLLLLLALCVTGSLMVSASAALASEGGPQWTVTAVSAPTNFAPGDQTGDDVYKVLVTNTGGVASDGEPVTITDVLPAGLTLDHARAAGFELGGQTEFEEEIAPLRCESLTCTFSGSVIPEQSLIVTIPVDVALNEPSTVTNVVRVSGGGAPDAIMETLTRVSSEPAGFDIASGSATTALSSTQAGAHADLTTTVGFNTLNREGKLAGAAKEVVDDLPPGFAGDLVDTPTCPVGVFGRNECPIGTQIGVKTATFNTGKAGKEEELVSPVYNLTPDPGDVAKFGFSVLGDGIQADVKVNPDGYGLQTRFQNISQAVTELDSVSLTVWAVPTATIHDPWRWDPDFKEHTDSKFGASSTNPLVPYLASPTSCTSERVTARVSSRSWQEPEREVSTKMPFGPFVGCDRLRMPATLTAVPTTLEAYAPTGLNAELGVHQTYENAEGLSSAHLNKAVVKLPEGMTVNPSAGAGLGSCTLEEYEQEVLETPGGEGCPEDSKLGSVKIQAPAIKEEAFGSVFIATPYENPFSEPEHPDGSLLALYVVARIPNRGVIVKSAGKVEANPVTGQLTTVFENLPQLPFTTFTLSFRQGETSPLVTPPACGSFTATAELTPWSDLSQVATAESPPFEIVQGFGGGLCPTGGVPPFSPGVSAGTEGNDAGAYSPFDLRVTRNDGEQEITGFASQLPPGLTADLTGVPFCSEAEIALARTKTGAQEEAEPACPAASEIGQTLVGAGVGSVLAVAPGKIYMAGPMPPAGPNQPGAPFSVVAITSAKVGPFDLGTVVVHLPLEINPETAAVSIPAGAADQIPHIIRGIVVHVRDIRVYIDKPNFTLNPTNCAPLSFSATVIGSGASFSNPAAEDPVTVSDPFQAVNCTTLAFKPAFKVSTSGKTSKANGASLTAKLSFPSGALGSEANISRVKVDLPRQLPSRLTTLQKACTAAQFHVNPAGCPAASIIGHAKAITPILPVPIEGPAYFVSNGGESFPNLIIVLQGYGVTIDLVGDTFISKAGITSSTFKTVPDQPVTSFELTLPQGPYSALAANGNLCGLTKTVTVKKKVTVRVKGRRRTVTRKVKKTEPETLAMPTEFVAQNGATIHQITQIGVTGCSKGKKAKATKKKHDGKAKKGRK